MADGKAVLTREDYCDGLGDCLPACPAGAITFEEREAPAYDEAAVLRAKRERQSLVPEARPGLSTASRQMDLRRFIPPPASSPNGRYRSNWLLFSPPILTGQIC